MDTEKIDGRKILIFSPNWIGDTIMSMPMVRALRSTWPDVYIVVIAKPYVASLWGRSTYVNEVWEYGAPKVYNIISYAKLTAKIRRVKFDLVILLPHYFRYGLVAMFAGIPQRLGYDVRGRGICLTRALKYGPAIKEKHMTVRYLDIINNLEVNPVKNELFLEIGPEEGFYAQTVMQQNGINENNLVIGIAPGAVYGRAKRWPEESYAQAADQLVKMQGVVILIFAGPSEKALALKIKNIMRYPSIIIEPRSNLKEIASLIKRCALFISNDSGLMHMAVAVKTKTIALFGSTSPKWTGPYGDGHIVLQRPTECSPCFRRKCRYRTYHCLRAIPVEEVLNAAVQMLNGGKRKESIINKESVELGYV